MYNKLQTVKNSKICKIKYRVLYVTKQICVPVSYFCVDFAKIDKFYTVWAVLIAIICTIDMAWICLEIPVYTWKHCAYDNKLKTKKQ